MVTATGPYVIGLDGGTEGLRVGIFDTDGRPVVFVRTPYATEYPRPGWAEQDPEEWWNAVVSGIRSALSRTGIAGGDIASITLAATSCSLVCLDASGAPLRPAIIWMDVRAGDEANEVAACGSESLRLSGGKHASAEWLPSKALWLSRNQPEIYNRTTWLAEYVDFITWRLSGERTASLNTAAIRSYYDAENGGWPHELFSTLGLHDLEDKLPDTVLPMGAVAGALSRSAQEELGLPSSVSIVVGGADALVAQIGMGTVVPGELALITGSSHLALLQSEKRTHGDGTFGGYPHAVIEGQYTIEGGQTSTGSMLEWYRRLIDDGEYSAKFFESLTPLAELLPVGSEGLLVLDHWQGNRTPYIDARSRGALMGLTLSHRREHIYRALIESVCFGTENTLERFRDQGHEITRAVVCGGAVNSPLWLQLHANVSALTLEVNDVAEAATLGSAILGAVGSGLFPTINDAVTAMVHSSRVIEPDMDAHAEYLPFFEAYKEAYKKLRDVLHFLASAQRAQREPVSA